MEKQSILKRVSKTKVFQLLLIWIALVIIFTVWAILIGEKFLSIETLLSIGDLMIVSAFLGVGAGFLMVSGNMDLSASAIGAFGCVFFAAALKYWGWNTYLAMVVALILCAIFGLFNGLLVNEFRCPAFIATMSMAFVAKGVMQWVSVSPETGVASTVGYYNDITQYIANGTIFGVKTMFLLAIVVFIVYGLILSKSAFGMKMYLVGGNPQAANLTGINPKKMIYILFANSGFLAGIAGIIYMGRASQGDLNALSTSQFTGLTAAILGGISFGGGNGNMAGVFVGLLILNTFSKGMVIVRASSYWTTVLTGVLLLVALTIDMYTAKKARKALMK